MKLTKKFAPTEWDTVYPDGNPLGCEFANLDNGLEHTFMYYMYQYMDQFNHDIAHQYRFHGLDLWAEMQRPEIFKSHIYRREWVLCHIHLIW